MKIIYHLGLHCTDEHRLIDSLRRNADLLAQENIVVPDPERYRPVLRDTMNTTRGTTVSHETQETILDAVMDEDEAERVIFSNQSFLCKRDRVLGEGALYPMAGEKVQWMTRLFPDHKFEFHFAIRNPATFIPALFAREKERSYEEFMAGIAPHKLRWSELIGRIRAAVPEAPVTVWCDEDTPLIWPEVLQAVSGHDPKTHLAGAMDNLVSIMSEEGLRRLAEYLDANPTLTVAQRRRITAAFLDKYALEDEMEVELDLPGWDADYVDGLTDLYENDVVKLGQMPGVTVIEP